MIRHPVSLALGLLALLVWAPLPFGSVTPRGAAVVELAGFAVLALASLLAPAQPLPPAVRRVALALLAVGAVGLAQSLAWPATLVGWLSPEHLRLAGESAALLEQPAPAFVSLSLAPATSRRAALVWLLGAAALLGGALLGRARRGRRAILAVLVASALFQIGFGALQWGQPRLWGVELPWRGNGLGGTYVNRNHLATYLLVAGAALFAFVWWLIRRRTERYGFEHRLLRLAPAILLWVTLFAGLALTGSRAGLLAGLAGLAAQAASIGFGGARRRALLAGAVLLGLTTALLVLLGFRSGFDRLLNPTEGGGFRLEAMADTARLVARFPITGVGLGGFRAAFPLVHEVEGEEWMWWHAHNDWLELAATTGLVGFAFAIFGVVALARGLREGWRRGERSEDRAAALAAIGACVAVGLQELLDFGLTIPANSVTLAVVCGAALAVPLRPLDGNAAVAGERAAASAAQGGEGAARDESAPGPGLGSEPPVRSGGSS